MESATPEQDSWSKASRREELLRIHFNFIDSPAAEYLHRLQRLTWLVEGQKNNRTMFLSLKDHVPVGYQGPMKTL